MKILITNDDGVNAPGIAVLTNLMRGLGEVTVVAPNRPRSGMSQALTTDSPLMLHLLSDEPGLRRYACTGTPADCVKLGLAELFGGSLPDLVVSGINHGSNSAVSVLYSGTMGAALEGCVSGVHAIGYSLCDHAKDADFSAFASYIPDLTMALCRMDVPAGTCFNVNAPAGAVKGIRAARQCAGRWVKEFEKRVDPHGRPYYWMTGEFLNEDAGAEDTDEYWLGEGYITVVPVKVDMTDFAVLQDLKGVVR